MVFCVLGKHHVSENNILNVFQYQAGALLPHFLNYETKHEALLSRTDFWLRVSRNSAFTLLLIALSLLVGMCGYHFLEQQSWLDAFVSASMILAGMGPVSPLETVGGKLFASCYALYSGLALVLLSGLLIAPVLHRAFHRFHLEDETE